MSKITHEQAKEVMMKLESEDVYYGEYIEEHKIMATYIKQQERDSELSELYKELATLYRDRFDYTDSASEIQRLWVKIKEKENE